MLLASLPAVVTRIARTYERTLRATVECRYHRILRVHAGPGGQTQAYTMDVIYRDGRIVRARVLRYTIDGAPARTAQERSVVATYEHPKPGDVFEAPWDPRFMHQYRDELRGTHTIVFRALDRSYGHGDGSFTFDARDDVVSYRYSPTVLPPHATRGTVSGTRAEVLSGYWSLTSERQTYSGRYGIFAASATLRIDLSHFRRVGP